MSPVPGPDRGPGQELPACSPGAGVVQAYEHARAAALGQRGDGFRHGLAVISANGMAAWLALQAAAPPLARPAAASPATATLPAGQIVTILAAMTLAAITPRP